ncbi:hypothetical protein Xvtw_00505 [Xanthomonas campestris pv. vitiswoodrowii]|nr:hypothetical protein Xvtw_00505 [Xanthomonas campestris pv. vitiswoodrowii]
MSLPAAAALLQSPAFWLAAVMTGLTTLRSVLLTRLASRQPEPQRRWQTDTARAATRHATVPMHWSFAALVIGATRPKLALLLAAT